MFKNVAAKFIVFAFDATTNVPKTGDAAQITAYVSKDYGAVTVLADTTATEMDATNAPGYYLFDAAQGETNADVLLVSAKSSTANVKVIGAPAVIYTRPTTGWLAPTTAARTLTVDASGRALADVDTIKTQAVTLSGGVTIPAATLASTTNITGGTITTTTNLTNLPAITANWLTAAGTAADFGTELATAIWTDTTAGDFTVALSVGKSVMNGVALGTGLTVAAVSGAVGSVTGAVGSVTGAVGSVTGSVGSVVGLTAATVMTDLDDIQARLPAALTADGNIKADALRISGSNTAADNLEESTEVIGTGTCDALGTTTAVIASAIAPASAVNDQYNGRVMIFKGNVTAALAGQATTISDYVHATLTFTVVALTTAPASGDLFVIL